MKRFALIFVSAAALLNPVAVLAQSSPSFAPLSLVRAERHQEIYRNCASQEEQKMREEVSAGEWHGWTEQQLDQVNLKRTDACVDAIRSYEADTDQYDDPSDPQIEGSSILDHVDPFLHA
jgi:hypothetical protein